VTKSFDNWTMGIPQKVEQVKYEYLKHEPLSLPNLQLLANIPEKPNHMIKYSILEQ